MPISKQQQENIKQCILECLSDKEFLSNLAIKVADKVTSTVQQHLDRLEERVRELEGKSIDNEVKISELNLRLNKMEQNGKRKQLRLLGLKETTEESLEDSVQEILVSKFKMEKSVISNCHRIGQKNISQDRPRPVVIKFTSVSSKNEVFRNKRNLKNSQLLLVEELSKLNYELLKSAKERVGRREVWSLDGRIFIKWKGKKHIVGSTEEMEGIIKS